MAVMAVSCIDKTPDYGNFATKDVDFTYRVDDDRYGLDFYVVSTVEFTNTSSKTGSVSWDFGDGTTSTDMNQYFSCASLHAAPQLASHCTAGRTRFVAMRP